MKKRILFLVVAMILVASLVMVGCSSSPSTSSSSSTTAATVYKLKYGDQNANTGWEGTQAAQPWLNSVTKATNNQVQFETYFSQALFKGVDSWDSVKNGLGDVAWMFHGYWANKTTLADVVSLPLMPFKSAKQASGILWQLYEKYPNLKDQFKENHVLLTFTSDAYFLATTKKQVKTLDDLKGLNIRVTSGPPIDMMKAFGANPVTKGMPDTYIALQKGEIDGMLVSWEALLSFRQYEVLKYYTYFPGVTVYFTQAMNIAKWNSLPKDVQDQINSVCGLNGSTFWGQNMFDTAGPECKKNIKAAGLEMIEYTLPADELAKWSAVGGQPIWDAWVKARTADGFTNAQEILNTTQDLIKTYNP